MPQGHRDVVERSASWTQTVQTSLKPVEQLVKHRISHCTVTQSPVMSLQLRQLQRDGLR